MGACDDRNEAASPSRARLDRSVDFELQEIFSGRKKDAARGMKVVNKRLDRGQGMRISQ